MDRAYQIYPKIERFISKHDNVLDIGCGTASIAKVIKKEKGAKLTLVDVQYNPICDQYPVTIYDGRNLPFADNQFSVSLITSVLHHSHDPLRVIAEAARVTSDKIIIMEDVFTDLRGKIITFIGDCLVNWEIHSPHNNLTTKEWLKVFKIKKLAVVNLEEFNLRCVGFPFKLAIFVLAKKKKNDG